MADLLVLDVYRDAQTELVRRAIAEIEAFLATVDISDGYSLRAAVEAILPEIVAQYGEAIASLAADRYDLLRDFARVPGAYTATPAAPVPAERVIERSRWATSPVWRGDPEQALSNLRLIVDEYVKQPGRDTIAESAERDPAKAAWARVPRGSETCAFCLMLASRGAVYWSREKAMFRDNGGKYHGDCDCEPVPVWNGDTSTLPPGYDPDALLKIWEKGVERAGSGDPKAVLAAVREVAGAR